MVVGLATYIEGFQAIVGELTRDFEVFYIETREKSSSILSGKVKFDMETIARDIISIIKLFELEPSSIYSFWLFLWRNGYIGSLLLSRIKTNMSAFAVSDSQFLLSTMESAADKDRRTIL